MTRTTRYSAPALALLVAACAGVTPQQNDDWARETAAITGRNTPLLVDGCVVRSEFGDQYILRRASVSAANSAGRAAQDYLNSHGLTAANIVAPFLCGTTWFEPGKGPQAVADTKHDVPVSVISPPLPVDERIARDAPLANAYRQLLASASAPLDGSIDLSQPRPLVLDDTQSAMLARDLGSHHVWVLSISGTDVSAAKSIGIGMATGIATLLIGGVGFVSMPVDGNAYQLALVDIDRSRVVWQKQLLKQRGNVSNLEMYDPRWAKAAFAPFVDPDAPAAPVIAGDGAATMAPQKPAVTPPAAPAAGVALRERPKSDARVLQMASAASLQSVSTMHNADGDWCYIDGAGMRGWVRAEDLATR